MMTMMINNKKKEQEKHCNKHKINENGKLEFCNYSKTRDFITSNFVFHYMRYAIKSYILFDNPPTATGSGCC